MNRILLIIIALIIALGAFTFLGNKKMSPTTNESMKSQETTPSITQLSESIVNVELTDVGFLPKDITIKAGTRVIWVNKSGKTATVSSDDHPTHRLYPFLNLGEFANGSSVQVVFDTVGEYSYHDHYNASQTGIVTVE